MTIDHWSNRNLTLMIGSAPLTYLMVRPGYLAGRSLLMNAATFLQTCSMIQKTSLYKERGLEGHLRVSPQTSSAHFEDGPLVLDIVKSGGATVVGAASLTVRHHGAEFKLLQVLAGRTQQLGRVETTFQAPGVLV